MKKDQAAPRAPNPLLSRRRLLQVGAATAGALGVGAWLFARGAPEEYDAVLTEGGAPLPSPSTLSRKELAVLTLVVDRMIGAEPPLPSPRKIGVARRIDRELSFHGEKLQDDVKAALFLVEHGGLLQGSPGRFSRASPDEQDARLRAMSQGTSIERQVFVALRTLSTFFYYVDDSTWPHIHYDGPLVGFRTRPAADSSVDALDAKGT